MFERLRIAPTLAIVLLTASGSGPKAQSQPDERTAIYHWIDSLGFDALRNGQFGVFTSRTVYGNGAGGNESTDHGFLVSQSGPKFEVLTDDLNTKTFPTSSFGSPVTGEWRASNFSVWAESQWKALKNRQDEANSLSRDVLALVIFSRSCAARGLPKLADQSFKEAKSRNSEQRLQPSSSLIDRLQLEYKGVAKYQATDAFMYPDIPRKRLLAKFQRWVNLFPNDPDPYMHESAEILATMIKEDDAHPKIPDSELAAMPTDLRVRELIFRLRDQSGYQFRNPGDVYFLGEHWEDRKNNKSTAAALARMGFSAVPQLIEALSDRRFTRAFRMMKQTEYLVPRVQDAAFQILCDISHQQFDPHIDGTIYFGTSEAEPFEVQVHRQMQQQWEGRVSLIHKWWSTVETKGEKQALVESIERGDSDSVQAAKRLVEIDPGDVMTAVKRGMLKIEARQQVKFDPLDGLAGARRSMQQDQDKWAAKGLLQAITPLATAEVRDFAKDQMLNGSGVDVRVEAAELYARWDSTFAVESMSGRLAKLISPAPGESPRDAFSDCSLLIDFLAKSGSAPAIELLRRGMDRRKLDEAQVLQALAPLPKRTGKLSPSAEIEKSKYESSVEALLASRLERIEYTPTGSEQRYCTLAAEQLAQNWPAKYIFDGTGSFEHQRAQCIQCLNVWRRAQGLPPTALEKTNFVIPIPEGRMQPLIQAFDAAPNSQAKSLARRKILELGLPALQAVKSASESNPKLAEVAQELSSIVRDVVVVDVPPDCAKPFIKQLKAMKGKPVTGEALSDLLNDASATWTPGSPGFTLTAERDMDSEGFVLTLQFFDFSQHSNGNTGWSCDSTITVNGQMLTGGGGLRGPGIILISRQST